MKTTDLMKKSVEEVTPKNKDIVEISKYQIESTLHGQYEIPENENEYYDEYEYEEDDATAKN